ncbi:MAG TPA: ABC-F family ATP-binding cassette domain-containing protein [Solirubrobacteraceae bacterium]|nr:ABC-F family ATP-binding cassette domain-containing protein [Solirubrobacteraceae bacterium]
MLTASGLVATYGDTTIFDNLSLTLSGSRRVALVGPNGAGKTTLLRLLAGVTAPEGGSVTLGPGDRVGYLPQEPPGAELTIDHLLGAALGEVWELHAELEQLVQRLDDPAALAAYGEAQERFGALGGWALQAQLDGARAALGIAHVPLDVPLGELSGGEAARALLAGVLLARPTILLLDEPTNHLDLDGLAWLEEFLVAFPGAVLVVSHDRRFLDTTVSQVVELADGELETYEGGYTEYHDEKARRAAKLASDYEAQQKRHRRLEADIVSTLGFAKRTETTVSRAEAPRMKRYAKKVAKKGKARERRLRREIESDQHIDKPRHVNALKIELDSGGGARLVAALRGVSAGWDGEPLLHDVSLTVQGRDRIAITGPNGAGKSTLLALLQGELAPLAGTVDRPVRAAVLPQGADALPADVSAVAFVRSHAHVGEGEARRLLGHFGLEGAASLRVLGRLSPGERARTAIAAMVAARAELLLLDEPTNHLDFPSLDVLEAALRDYPGAIVAVSHDRAFLDAIGTDRRLQVRDGVVTEA